MQDSLGGQHFALAAEAAAVLLLGSGRLDHRTHPRFATLVGEQRANQRFAVDLVGLRPPAPPRCRNRGRIDNKAFYSLILQHPIDPEAIEPSFLDDDQRENLPRPYPRLLPELRKALQQPAHIAATHRMHRHLLSTARRQRGDQPARSAQFQRNEDCSKVGADRGRCFELVSRDVHGQLQNGWRQPSHLARESIATSNTPWDLEKVDVQADAKVESGKADTPPIAGFRASTGSAEALARRDNLLREIARGHFGALPPTAQA